MSVLETNLTQHRSLVWVCLGETFELIRVPINLVIENGRATHGELLAYARVEPLMTKTSLILVAKETAATLEHGLALLQRVVLGS